MPVLTINELVEIVTALQPPFASSWTQFDRFVCKYAAHVSPASATRFDLFFAKSELSLRVASNHRTKQRFTMGLRMYQRHEALTFANSISVEDCPRLFYACMANKTLLLMDWAYSELPIIKNRLLQSGSDNCPTCTVFKNNNSSEFVAFLRALRSQQHE